MGLKSKVHSQVLGFLFEVSSHQFEAWGPSSQVLDSRPDNYLQAQTQSGHMYLNVKHST